MRNRVFQRYLLYLIGVLLSCHSIANEKMVDKEDIYVVNIFINNQNVFDLENDKENGLLYRAANKLHYPTRKHTIYDQLLFKAGESTTLSKIKESERILRKNRYIVDTRIEVDYLSGNQANINVKTSDAWSTKPSFSFGRQGGKNKSEFGIEEVNFLGKGIQIGVARRDDFDRRSTIFEYYDKNAFRNHSLDIEYKNSSDGYTERFQVIKPFLSLESRQSYSLSVRQEQTQEALYFKSKPYFIYDQYVSDIDVYWGRSEPKGRKGNTRHIYGLNAYKKYFYTIDQQPTTDDELISAYVSSNDLLDYNRDGVYLYYQMDYIEDCYETTVNRNKQGLTEDNYVGLKYSVKFAYTPSESDLYGTAWKLHGNIGNHLKFGEHRSLDLSAEQYLKMNGYHSMQKTKLEASYYQSLSTKWKLYSHYSMEYGKNLAKSDQLFLGDTVGIRGYQQRFASGTETHLLTLESRYYSNFTALNILNVGYSAFVDVGRVSGGKPFEQRDAHMYRTAGLGLRLSNNRSAFGKVTHIDLSYPFDDPENNGGLQISVYSKATF